MLKKVIDYLSLIMESAKKEKRLIFKDDAVVEIYIVFVVLVYFFYTFVYSPEIFTKLPVAYVDNDQTTITHKIRRMLNETESLDLTYDATSLEEGKRMFEEGKVSGIILIPKGFSAKLQKSGGNPSIAIYSDASYMLYYDKTLQAVTNAMGAFTGDLQLKQTMMSGVPMKEAVASSKPFNVISTPLYNLEEGYAIFIIPLVLIVALQTLQLTGMGVLYGTLRERGTFITNFGMARRRFGFIFLTIGRAIPYLVLSMLLLLLGIKVVFHIFTIPQRGDIFEVFAFLVPVVLSITFLGMVLMNIFRNREDTIMLCTVFSIPALMMGGVSYPIVAFPLWIKVLGFFFPSTIGVKGFLALSQAGASLNEIKDIYIQMWLICIFYFILALWTNRRFLYFKTDNNNLLALPEADTISSQEFEKESHADTKSMPPIPSEGHEQALNDSKLNMTQSSVSVVDLLLPMSPFISNFEQLVETIAVDIQDKAKNKTLQSPPTYITVPLLQALQLALDTPELKELYLNLLINCMDCNSIHPVHPNFINSIKSLAPDEIRLLSVFLKLEKIPYINIKQISKNEDITYDIVLEKHVHVLEEANIKVSFVNNLSMYFENLERIGIFAPANNASLEPSLYIDLENCGLSKNVKKEIENKGYTYKIERQYFKLSAYGRSFIQAAYNTNISM